MRLQGDAVLWAAVVLHHVERFEGPGECPTPQVPHSIREEQRLRRLVLQGRML